MAVTKAQKEQLTNYASYGFYEDLAKDGYMEVDAHIFTRRNIDDHFNSITAILSDGIETEYVQRMMVHLIFTDGEYVDLTITEYMFCLMFFTLPLEAGQEIDSDKLFWVQDITQDEICEYINNKFIKRYRTILPFMQLNQTIDTIYTKFREIRKFQPYLMNTVNLKDTIDLMNKYKEFDAAIHCDASGVPIEEVKAKLEAGTLHVFDINNFTVNSKKVTSYLADVDSDEKYTGDTEVIKDGYFHESEFRSAPYFDLNIDGITNLGSDYKDK